MELDRAMGKLERSKKMVDWVALIDELWTSDDESMPKSRGQPSRDEKASSTGSTEASVRERDVKESSPPSVLGEESLQTDQCPPDKVFKVVADPTRLSEDPLTDRGDISPNSPPSSQSTNESSIPKVHQTSHRIRKIRQTDLLSFIDHKYSQANRAPLVDIENLHSDSTDDGYMTSDNSRLEYTPQLSLPDTENETKHPRVLFSQKSTRRHVRKRKASELLGTAKRFKVHHTSSDAVKKENEEQLYLDLGQKNFGHMTCKVCGMIYTIGQPSDQAEHLHFHKSFLSGVNFPGWKKEHIVGVFYDGRIIMVLPTDPKLHLKKIEEIRKLVDLELGYASGASMASKDYKVFLYISLRKRVMGCVIAEKITRGYQVLSDSGKKEGNTSDSWLCSTAPQPAQLGINRLWVSGPSRRKGIASKLLDAARSNFVASYVVPKSKVAFSDPTPDGRAFASRYCSTPNFLVYRWL